ncbi:acetoacetate decarboxylase family protein [Euzebya rosea]|uniref:acetoacetate decarboxylase family protein n=1 Tax=Euzebya rosea TaxID=2052804 RepID=UPI000D3ED82A|nr:acetoacetate decarboxylase family protein [Euzebya rosea]
MTGYPAEPWDLRGTGAITMWHVDHDRLPVLPKGTRPLTVAGRAVVATAFVRYDERGLMGYHELLAAVVVRHGLRPALSITDIWVDSEVSMAGGRGLWGIPKQMATFDIGYRSWSASTADGLAAAAAVEPAGGPDVRLPFPLPGRVVQTLDGRTVASRIRAGGRVRRTRSTWEVPPAGPLGWLSGASPVVHIGAPDFAMTFGSAPRR